MTLWHGPSSVFGRGKKFISHDIVQYEQGRIWIVAGLAEDGHLYYFTRKWEGGQTVESEAQLISDMVFPTKGASTIFRSEKDGFFQFSISTENGIVCFWIKPEELFPRPQSPMLDEDLQAWKLYQEYGHPIYLCPIFIPSLLFNHQIKDTDFQRFLDKVIKEPLGNAIRAVLAGGWEPKTYARNHVPYVKKDGKYQLPHPDHLDNIADFINPEWESMVIRRLRWEAERGLTSITDLIDQCSLHNYKHSHWGLHWMNPKNNNRNCHPKGGSQYHYEEYWPGGRKEGEKSRAETEQYRVTGVILEAFYRHCIRKILDEIPVRFHEFIALSAGNEVRAGAFWHKRMAGMLDEFKANNGNRAIPFYRRITSMSNSDFYKKQIHLHFNYAKHTIGDLARYEWAVEICNKAKGFLPSCDGGQFPAPALVEKLVTTSLSDGNYGWELLTGLWDQSPPYDLSKLDLEPARAMMKAFNDWK